MGGTKKKATVPIKKESKYKIPSRFDCPLCDAKNTIGVKLFRNTWTAKVHCRSCRAGDKCEFPFVPLEKPVDVFFRFREEMMKQDQDFLLEHHIKTQATKKTGLGQLVLPKPEVRGRNHAGVENITLDNSEDDGDLYIGSSSFIPDGGFENSEYNENIF
ncbi:transcription elongation factor 1 like [Trypanosoma vivax]|uniref:Transcription elongation factor 1 homolog n=1 Tax=Trypanosoma vivax (strain Y486) TaxID=1055687 RepID=G0TR63_TRYVY|nr:hypothetical protein TRVL_04523 [Trypanosoma vivax]KAH8612039.1 transcription elongation factor 1 like [Trypanosoma vivax]CCC46427.1 conserved hypothetical protein [Trypanosoma vivax Y486]